MAGQTILAIANPFIFNMPPKIAACWFPYHEKLISLNISGNSFLIGSMLAFLTSKIIMTEGIFQFKNHGNAAIQEQLEFMMFVHAIVATIICILVIIFFKSMYFNKYG